jgi:hypothetical protein
MREFYQKYQGYFPASFFVGGFLFDLLTTDRIDQSFSLIQQALYLFFIFLFFYWEVLTPQSFKKEGSFLYKVWGWHVEALHFLFGCLLSLYTIFYFKSASLMTSFIFMIFLAVILVINELPQFQKRGIMMRSSLLALCLSSYLIYLVPVITGSLGLYPFILAMVLSMSLFYWICVRIQRLTEDTKWVAKNMMLPGLIIQLSFVGLYFFKVLPPVPISLKYIGIYHDIQKQDQSFVLSYERDWWRFWQSGAQTYLKREGDKLYCFVSIFSPTQFSDQMQIVWYYKGRKGWGRRDAIPLQIRGGRDQGYRGYAVKSNFEEGAWQVRVITSDKREVGRIYFDVTQASPLEPRQWRQDLY